MVGGRTRRWLGAGPRRSGSRGGDSSSRAGGRVRAGSIVVQGEDLAGWGRAQQIGWDKLSPAQQWLCEHVLGLEPLPAEQRPAPKVSHAEKEQRNLAAAAQFREREGH
ncbi:MULTISPECIES: hypothetical protein [unclassified Kitasatospora]|uniref:hypothetical protein n=1 Tax=unclassified Kitasatospora TaxID=2633591 RepID=UPI000709EBF5|nr:MULTISPECIES: hypothetical protein [unclassified Kitasatospora]KQV16006.1 hypothetical protein ASC99_29175 [Kitasatospora sp. Root107]KRB65118.1 hypothetical protein ASE03_32585 [Kitasatospora sp. Root187]